MEPKILAYRRFRWRQARRLRFTLQAEPSTKRKSGDSQARAIQQDIHLQLSRVRRHAFRGPIAVELTFHSGTHTFAIHAMTKWILDLLGPRRYSLTGTNRRYLAYRDDAQVAYLEVVSWPSTADTQTGSSLHKSRLQPSEQGAINITIRSLEDFRRDLELAVRLSLDLDKPFKPRFDLDSYENFLENRDLVQDVSWLDPNSKSTLEKHAHREAQGFFAESSRLGLRRLDALFTSARGSARVSPDPVSISELLDRLRARDVRIGDLEGVDRALADEMVTFMYEFLLQGPGLRVNLLHGKDYDRGFTHELHRLFTSYFKRFGSILDPYFLPPAVELLYLHGSNSAGQKPDLDNQLRSVLSVMHQTFPSLEGSFVNTWQKRHPYPLTCEVVSVPQWELTGFDGVTSVGLIPGGPYYESYSSQIDQVVDQWAESFDEHVAW